MAASRKKKRTGKYYEEYKRELHNLRNKAYRAKRSGLEYDVSIPSMKKAPTKRDLERLQKQSARFDKDVAYTTSEGETIRGRKAARSAMREDPIVVTNEREGKRYTIDRATGEITSEEYIPTDYYTDSIDEDYPTDYYTDSIDEGKILHQRLVELIETLEGLLSPAEIAIMATTPAYERAIMDIRRTLLDALSHPTRSMYKNVEEFYDEILACATEALHYEENTSVAIQEFFELLETPYDIAQSAEWSDIGDYYDEE